MESETIQEPLDRFLVSVERKAFVMARMATRDTDEALDIVQDAMQALVEKYAGRPEAEWPPVFYRILNNRIRDWHRRQKIRNLWRGWLKPWSESNDRNDDPLEQIQDPGVVDPGEGMDRKASMARLEVALANLPLRQREAFLLRAWNGLDVASTAVAMGCSVGSVKTHYSRAIHTLRQFLEEYRP
ncbi:MAG: RNA polymerase sigma factor [Thermodesulfobacteriota bacterium]